jgi:hypothetical protein
LSIGTTMAEEERPTITVDAASRRLATFFGQHDWERVGAAHALETIRRARMRVGETELNLSGKPASDYLALLIAELAQELVAQVQAWGPVRWLWYLRRLPVEVFQGAHATTGPYDLALAESISCYSRGSDASVSERMVVFRTDESAFRHLSRYVTGVRALADLHSQYRRVGKGARLDLRPPLPICERNAGLEEFIRIYDQRTNDAQMNVLAGLGLASAEAIGIGNGSDPGSPLTIYLIFACKPFLTPVPIPKAGGGMSESSVVTRHIFKTMGVDGLLPKYASSENIQKIEPLITLLMLFVLLAATIPWVVAWTLQFGYFFAPKEVVHRTFDEWLPLIARRLSAVQPEVQWNRSYAEWLRAIQAIQPGLWPLRSGGVLRELGNSWLVDVTTATNALVRNLFIDRTGAVIGKARANAFELAVQKMVQDSPWAPSEELATLRGRTLRRGGAALTDIDALGLKGDTLLLISCKSLIYDLEYDKGAHQVIRNAQSTVDDAVADWTGFIQGVRDEPVGDNFDFRAYPRILGIVCTPFVVFSSNRATVALVKEGLRACCSAEELQTWISKSEPPKPVQRFYRQL